MEASVKSYILRIYRFDRKSPDRLVGLAEEVGAKEKRAFTNLQELWDLLCSPEKRGSAEKGKGKAPITGIKRKSGKARQKAPDSLSGVREENGYFEK